MKAYILAAGIGSRLYPLTETKPKCLVRVHGKSILEYQIEGYLAAGLREEDIVVVAGYRADQVHALLKSQYPGVTLLDNTEFMTTNNMCSLRLGLEMEPDSGDGAALISNGDCIYDTEIMKGLVAAGGKDLVAADRGVHIDESMKIEVVDGVINNISKEIGPNDAWGVSIDLYSLSAGSVKKLREIMTDYIVTRNERKLWTEVALKDLFEPCSFAPFNIDGKNWVEIDNIDDLRQADRLFGDFSLDGKKCIVCDLDGTVYLGKQPIKPTVDYIIKSFDKLDFFFLTNNTSKTPDDYVARLKSLGIDIDSSRIVSPYIPLIDHLSANGIERVNIVGNRSFCEYLQQRLPSLELTDDPDKCQAVIVAYDTELTYEKLRIASLLLQSSDITFLATHCDIVCPTEDGPIPDIGSILALLETAIGRVPDEVFGKPNPTMLDRIRENYSDQEILVVGDRVYTDKVLAESSGVDFVLVLSGETTRAEVEQLDKFPTHTVDDLGELT